jgi:hypothetical protein
MRRQRRQEYRRRAYTSDENDYE